MVRRGQRGGEIEMYQKKIEVLIRKVGSLPPLPAAVEKINSLTQDIESDIADIARAISSDDALTARILRVANSAFYGLSRKINTVSQAIVILGFNAVKNLSIGISLFGLWGKEKEVALDREEFWRHCLAVGCGSRLLALRLKMKDPEEAFVAGLLHDIGKVILMEHFPKEYSNVIDEAESKRLPLYVLEHEVFGIDHAVVGMKICEQWKLSETISKVIGFHHKKISEQNKEEAKTVRTVQAASNLAKIARIGYGGESYVEPNFLRGPSSELFLPEYLRYALLVLPEEIHKVEVFFKLKNDEEEKEKESRKYPSVCVLLDDPNEEEFVNLMLLSLGCTLVSKEQCASTSVDAVISNGSLSTEHEIIAKNCKVLDFSKYKSDSGEGKGAILVESFKNWLEENLSKLGGN